jgi:hypothetical protein
MIKDKFLLFLLSKFARLFDQLTRISLEIKYAEYRKKYSLNKKFRFNGTGIVLYGNGEIEIGQESYIGSYSFLISSASAGTKNNKVEFLSI